MPELCRFGGMVIVMLLRIQNSIIKPMSMYIMENMKHQWD